MSELAFPLLGSLVVFFLAVPVATMLAKAALLWRRRATSRLPGFGTTTTWLLIVAPVIVPVVWFASAAVHESLKPGLTTACLHDALGNTSCNDVLVFAVAVSLPLLLIASRRLLDDLGSAGSRARPSLSSGPETNRLARLTSAHPLLRSLRVRAIHDDTGSISTSGLLRTRIDVSTRLMDELDDAALMAALLHEAEHAARRDPLRFLVASVCLSLNPLAALLRPEFERWRLARETACDEVAVRAGGDPLGLAHAIVIAAGATRPSEVSLAARLADANVAALRLRVGLILGYVEARPSVSRRETPLVALGALILAVVALPHALGSGPLDALHLATEQAYLVFRLLSSIG